MADLYLKAFRDWFDSNSIFLTEHSVKIPVLRQFHDTENSIAHAELETERYLGEVTLWEYEGYALADTDFVEIAAEVFHPKHYELHSVEEIHSLLNNLIMQMIASSKPMTP